MTANGPTAPSISALRKARADALSDNLLRSDFGSALRDGAGHSGTPPPPKHPRRPTAIPAMMQMVETARAGRDHTKFRTHAGTGLDAARRSAAMPSWPMPISGWR